MKIQKYVLIALCVLLSSCAQAKDSKEIHASSFMKDLKKGKNVEIANKIILDDVDFTSIEKLQMLSANQIQNVVEGNVCFINCIFMGKVTATGKYKSVDVQTKFNNNVIFENCDFRGDVSFDNAVVTGSVNFQQAKFRKAASFINLMAWTKEAYFSEIEAEEDINFIYATFNGSVYMRNAIFQKSVSFQGMTVQGQFAASGMKCAQSAEFDMLTVGQRAIFNYSTFEKQPTFIQARFHDDAEFVGITLQNLNEVFENTYVGGKLLVGESVAPARLKVEQNLLQKQEN